MTAHDPTYDGVALTRQRSCHLSEIPLAAKDRSAPIVKPPNDSRSVSPAVKRRMEARAAMDPRDNPVRHWCASNNRTQPDKIWL